MARVLITGGTGFIGSHLTRRCLARGDEVTLLVRPTSTLERVANIAARLDIQRVQLSDQGKLDTCLTRTRPEIVFHLGARTRFTPQDDLSDLQAGLDANLVPLMALLSACARAAHAPKAFIRAGTIAEYGPIAAPYHESTKEKPVNAYGLSMLAGTQFLTGIRGRLPFVASTARLALTYGPVQSADFLLPSLINACAAQQPIALARPKDRRDLIHVDDVVTALLRMGTLSDALPEVINIGTGSAPTMREVALAVITAMGASDQLVQFKDQRDDDAVELRIDPRTQSDVLRWTPDINLKDGIAMLAQITRPSLPHSTNRRSA
ncbi:Nucleoside-diphosphate-sugar epimerase [Aliiroseovarius halocynthiae]|uniref:NAD(P)-dependent oxidoreductase n=1 Tax=Aliiroseovarius halocynthiae TaxID=985055 RepID=A0A545SUI8_9RHOB|nr:NAD(P)-dependent oxidoreductase [Aliiroseovarius halocynthiae]TQV68641.1 NAD(P)-dependent oxidoreductase [Aliiroseovarius halocynthiae]SMR71060.1 Nucleoside-diphosphate-sugar epimerase [Aliiroseovarius halocynthiae]